MAKRKAIVALGKKPSILYQVIELGGLRFAVLAEAVLQDLCQQAQTEARPAVIVSESEEVTDMSQFEGRLLGRRVADRRRRLGLTQGDLAARAGVRHETVNRVERGKTSPDFSTIRKLVTALREAEANC